jgi:hypothetical protein
VLLQTVCLVLRRASVSFAAAVGCTNPFTDRREARESAKAAHRYTFKCCTSALRWAASNKNTMAVANQLELQRKRSFMAPKGGLPGWQWRFPRADTSTQGDYMSQEGLLATVLQTVLTHMQVILYRTSHINARQLRAASKPVCGVNAVAQ